MCTSVLTKFNSDIQFYKIYTLGPCSSWATIILSSPLHRLVRMGERRDACFADHLDRTEQILAAAAYFESPRNQHGETPSRHLHSARR